MEDGGPSRRERNVTYSRNIGECERPVAREAGPPGHWLTGVRYRFTGVRAANRRRERRTWHGSCGMGVGEVMAYALKHADAPRVSDVLSRTVLRRRLAAVAGCCRRGRASLSTAWPQRIWMRRTAAPASGCAIRTPSTAWPGTGSAGGAPSPSSRTAHARPTRSCVCRDRSREYV